MADPTADRKRLARHLDDHGPTPGDALAAALGVSADRFWGLVCCPWFDISGKGWRLTARGEAEAFPARRPLAQGDHDSPPASWPR